MPPTASTAAAHSCPRRQPSSRSVVRSTGAASIPPCDAPDAALASSQVHARNKPLDRSNDDALLRQIADLAIGYSGAELANLMNESAILAVSCCFLLCLRVPACALLVPVCACVCLLVLVSACACLCLCAWACACLQMRIQPATDGRRPVVAS